MCLVFVCRIISATRSNRRFKSTANYAVENDLPLADAISSIIIVLCNRIKCDFFRATRAEQQFVCACERCGKAGENAIRMVMIAMQDKKIAYAECYCDRKVFALMLSSQIERKTKVERSCSRVRGEKKM